MFSTLLLLSLLFISFAHQHHARDEPKRPMWAPKYKVSWNFSVPYISQLQKGGLTYHYDAYQDYEDALQRVTRDDLETVIIRGKDEIMYEIFPAQDILKCWKDTPSAEEGPTRRRRRLSMSSSSSSSAAASLNNNNDLSHNGNTDDNDDPPQQYLGFVLPDLSESRWVYRGTEKYHGNDGHADVWEWDLTEGSMEMSYTFYTSSHDGYPLELNMVGVNLYTGGHKDNYIAYFYNYQPVDEFPEGAFDPPMDVECTDAEPDMITNVFSSHRLVHHFRSFMPNVHWGDAAYDVYVHKHGRRHLSGREYATRSNHFKKSLKFIEEWNAVSNQSKMSKKGHGKKNTEPSSPRHTVAINHLADLLRREYLALLGRRPRPDLQRGSHVAYATIDNFTSSPHFLPAELVWKGTPADSPVKDQAACGSCWAFSSIAPMETALYRTTGKQQLLSEQYMMDCGWSAPGFNTACFGGEQDRAMEWAFVNGGLPLLENYPYRGVNDFCRHDAEVIKFTGKAVIVQGGEDALKAALMVKGPMAVSVDAESDAFRFYSGGIFYEPDCATAAKDLNHAVIASGYGTAEDGTEYWLVKNMWSNYWGEDGYIRIARHPNDCGISTEPVYVELDE